MVTKAQRPTNGFMGVCRFGSLVANLARVGIQGYWNRSSAVSKVTVGGVAAVGAVGAFFAWTPRVSAAADSVFSVLTGVLWTMAAVGALELYRRHWKEGGATTPVVVNLHFNGMPVVPPLPVQGPCTAG